MLSFWVTIVTLDYGTCTTSGMHVELRQVHVSLPQCIRADAALTCVYRQAQSLEARQRRSSATSESQGPVAGSDEAYVAAMRPLQVQLLHVPTLLCTQAVYCA